MCSQLLAVTRFSIDSTQVGTIHSLPGSASRPPDSLKKTILICEDDPDVLRVYRLALRSKYNVIAAGSGSECLQKYSETKRSGTEVDCLLLDYRLGDTTGDQVALKVRELNGTKVVLISAFEIDRDLVNRLKNNGSISMFVKKPVTIRELILALDNILMQ